MRLPSGDQSSSEMPPAAFQIRLKRPPSVGTAQPALTTPPLAGSGTRLHEDDPRAVGRKANSAGRGIAQLSHSAVGEVVEVARPDLARPTRPTCLAVGEKHDELPVARNGGVMSAPSKSVNLVNFAPSSGFRQKYSERCRYQAAAPPMTSRAAAGRGPPRRARLTRSPRSGDQRLARSRVAPRRRGTMAPSASSISRRASPMSRRRRFASFSRQRWSNRRMLAGVCAGRRVPVGFAFEDRRDRVGDRLARETPAGPSASRTPRSRTPRCRCACRPASHAPARDSCRRPCRRSRLPVFRRWRSAASAARRFRVRPAQTPSPGRSRAPSRCRRG